MLDAINYGTSAAEKKFTAVGLHTVPTQREPLAKAFKLRLRYVVCLPLCEADKSQGS